MLHLLLFKIMITILFVYILKVHLLHVLEDWLLDISQRVLFDLPGPPLVLLSIIEFYEPLELEVLSPLACGHEQVFHVVPLFLTHFEQVSFFLSVCGIDLILDSTEEILLTYRVLHCEDTQRSDCFIMQHYGAKEDKIEVSVLLVVAV